MLLSMIPRASSGGGGSCDIGILPGQVPTNAIAADKVQAKLDTYPILTKTVGTNNAQLTDNARVLSLLSTSVTPIAEAITTIEEDIVQLQSDIQNVGSSGGKVGYTAVTTENLLEGMYIHVYRDGSVTKCCIANAVSGLLANGYVEANYANGATVTYFRDGENTKGNDLPSGAIWLSATTPGRASSTPPAARSTHYLQELGESIGPNKHLVQFGMNLQLL